MPEMENISLPEYARKKLTKGELFQCEDQHVALLKATGQAKEVEEETEENESLPIRVKEPPTPSRPIYGNGKGKRK